MRTIDKPGVSGSDDGEAVLDAEAFAADTPDDLVGCTRAAIDWATARGEVRDDGISLAGHSEGAMVVVDLVNELVTDGQRHRVATVVLSAFALMGTGATVVHQQGKPLEDVAIEFEGAEEASLEEALRQNQWSARTMRAWDARGPYSPRFLELLRARIPVLVLHGIHDDAAPAAHLMPMMDSVNAPWLSVMYGNAGHGGDASTVVQQLVWLDAFSGLDPATGYMGRYLEVE